MSLYEFPLLFPANGATLVGRVFRNVDNLMDPQPTVAITGAWLTVKEQMPQLYARALGELGYTAFTFDFTGFGQSEGGPRQLELPARKIDDIIAATDFLSTLSFVQGGGVGYLGVCASAQYAMAAIARGARIRSFASVAGWYHDAATIAPFYGGAPGIDMRLERAAKALDQFASRREVVTVPAYRAGDDRAGIFFELDYYASAQRGAVPAWKNEMAEMTWLSWFTFDGIGSASAVRVPTVMVHSDECVLPENAKNVFASMGGPKDLDWTEGTQIDFYDQPTQVRHAIAVADKHFRRTLGAD